MFRITLALMLVMAAYVLPYPAHATETYQTPDEFIAESFSQQPPEPGVVWLQGETSKTVESILGHRYSSLRIRYWQQDQRSAWILEEIGKERPITMGFVISDNKIESMKVLIYRESRGWEIRHDFFLEQFSRATLDSQLTLDRHIDSISGATLSVRAATNLARLALYLAQQVQP